MHVPLALADHCLYQFGHVEHARGNTHACLFPQVKSDFLAMLSESDAITERTQWKKVKGLYEKDVRYKAVGGVAQREEWFQEHVKTLMSKVGGLRERA